MNLAQTHDLLMFIAAYDNRRFDDATVYAWQEAVNDIPFDDARRAVIDHFRESREYLMPVHVRQGAVRIRNDRSPGPRLELTGAPAVAPEYRREETQALIRRVRDSLPDVGREILRRPEWVENDRRRARHLRSVPNPHFVALPPPDGFPMEAS